MTLRSIDDLKLGVIGLGYVGLPLAVEFGKFRPVIGFDINSVRIKQLENGHDSTLEVSLKELLLAKKLVFTDMAERLSECNTYIITVPTPIDNDKRPDLNPLLSASESVARFLKFGDVVIYESTIYPGGTEDECVPVLENFSGLKFNVDFFVGYSPERINPGDKEHRLPAIRKVTSGSTPEIAGLVDSLYQSIVPAGTYKAASIRIAEAAKVIENTQRDVNIALVNELAILFNKMGIDTEEVLKAARTKWNFLPFRPGLVGGHCIGVDPYYLTHKAEKIGYQPDVILAGRRINDGMGSYVSGQLIKAMLKRGIHLNTARVLIMGLTFKENCPDLRNSRVIDVILELRDYGVRVDVYDPWVDAKQALDEYDLDLISSPLKGAYEGIILAVAHDEFRRLNEKDIRIFGKPGNVLYDLKSILPLGNSCLRL